MNADSSTRAYLRNAILILALSSVLYFVGREVMAGRGVPSEGEPLPAAATVVVYYFSTGKECTTCEQIPVYAREALDTTFSKELAAGTLVWRTYDVDLPQNEHFVGDYGLYTKSIVLSRVKDGAQVRWKNLEKVWDLVGDHDAFVAYVRDEVAAMLESDA